MEIAGSPLKVSGQSCRHLGKAMWVYLYYFFPAALTTAEVITLIRGQAITCVLTGNSTNSIPWVQPNNETELRPTSTKYGDWSITKSETTHFGPVTDERWTKFPIASRHVHKISNDLPISFSVCTFDNFDLVLYSEDYAEEKINLLQNNDTMGSDCQWFSYTVKKSDDTTITLLSSNGSIIQQHTTELGITMFSPDTNKTKFHVYDFLSSNTISKRRKDAFDATYFGNLCVSMFVSLDKYCDLEITVESENKSIVNKTIKGQNEPNSLRKWKKIVINESFFGWWTVYLLRRRQDNQRTGFWAVDGVQACDPRRKIFQGILPLSDNTKYTCQIENDEKNLNFCNRRGYLGENCYVSCEEVLGKSYPNCEGHKICKGDNSCICSWGYTGPACDQNCGEGFWGADCNSKCETGCKDCNAMSGVCEKCEEQLFFGPHCSNITVSPMLRSITPTSVTIVLNIFGDQNDIESELFQIQYKKLGDELFSNYENQIQFNTNVTNVTFQINNLTTYKYSYIVRILLMVQGQAYIKNMPELLIHKKSLQANFTDEGTMFLTWNKSVGTSSFRAFLNCWRVQKFCPNSTIYNEQTILIQSGKFTNVQGFQNCNITLKENVTNSLIDEIFVKIPIHVRKTEIPKSIRFRKNKIEMELESCDKFFGPLAYRISLRCASKWCNSQTREEKKIDVAEYSSSIIVDLQNLLPFTTYAIEISAYRSAVSLSRDYGNFTTPSGKITNLEVYSRNESTLWLRWQLLDAVREILPKYRVSYKLKHQTVDIRTPVSLCELWVNFICTTITGLIGNTYYTITVQEDNMYLDLSEYAMNITSITEQEAPEAPENLSLALTRHSNVNLSWSNPLHLNGPLQQFHIQVELDGEVMKNYSVPVQEYCSIYHYSIPINNSGQYNISIWAINMYEGEKTTKSLTVTFKRDDAVDIWEIKLSVILIAVVSLLVVILCIMFNYRNKLSIFKRTRDHEYELHMQTLTSTPKLVETSPLIAPVPVSSNIGPLVQQDAESYKSLSRKQSVFASHEQYEIQVDKNTIDQSLRENLGELRSSGNFGGTKSLIAATSPPPKTVQQSVENLELLQAVLKGDLNKYNPVVRKYSSQESLGDNSVVGSPNAVQTPSDSDDESSDYYKTPQNIISSEEPPRNDEQMLLFNGIYTKNSTFIEKKDITVYVTNALNEGNEILSQFKSLSAVGKDSTRTGLQTKNKNRNRDSNNVPYDYNRVILKKLNGMGNQDYINASYIKSFYSPRAYIAAQSPKFSTVRDFWRMIWQERVEFIIMATNFIENRTRKCAEYCPQHVNTIFECGVMTIKLIKEQNYEHYVDRTFEVTYGGSSRNIRHFSMKWNPEYCNILYPSEVLPLVRQIRKCSEDSRSPIVIHCSSGVNRTGTLILCDLALQMIETLDGADFYALVEEMRQQRPNILKGEQQYVLAHTVISEYFLQEPDPFEAIKKDLASSQFRRQMSHLEHLCGHDKLLQLWMKKEKGVDESFPVIVVDGYEKVGKYLISPQPTKRIMSKFWNLIVKEEVACFVFLNNSKRKKTLKLWPYVIKQGTDITTIVEMKSYDTDYLIFTQLLLVTRNLNVVLRKYVITFFHMKNWEPDQLFPPSTDDILLTIQDVDKVHKAISNDKPVLISCHAGTSATTLFTVLSYIIEKYNKELIFDVVNGIRMTRRGVSQSVNTTEQLEFIYECLIDYLQKFDAYTSAE